MSNDRQYRHQPSRQNRPLEEVQAEQEQQQKPRRDKAVAKLPGGRKTLRYGLYTLAVLVILIGANASRALLPCRGIDVVLHRTAENDLIPASQIEELLKRAHGGELTASRLSDINLQALEDSLRAFQTIGRVELHKSLTGYLVADITVRRPVARVVDRNSNSCYLDQKGAKFPVSDYHSANVLVLRGDFDEELKDTTGLNSARPWPARDFGCITVYETLPVVNFICQDSFWNSQISEIYIAQDGQLTLYPQVGDAEIEFGHPVDIQEKFANLLLFYRQVPKEMGWKAYRKLSVKFRGQVVGRR